MVETRRQRACYEEYDEQQYQQAIRLSLIESGRFKKGKLVNLSQAKQKSPKSTRARSGAKGRVVKVNSLSKRLSHTVFDGKIKLHGIKYATMDYETLYKWQTQGKIKPPKLPNNYWPYPNNSGIKLGHNPWQHLNWRGPPEEDVRYVNTVLDQRHAEFEHKSYVNMPVHGVQSVVNVDVCIQTIFAQSTGNEIAIDTHCRLRNAFTYEKNGRRFAGKIPNWHTVRCLQQEELEQYLRQGGFHQVRARAIIEILDVVYWKNIRRRQRGIQQFEHEGNPPDAEDFVPGLLSLDFLLDGGDDSNEAVLGRLLDLPQIGLKSAMCIMAFAMKRECFPVDVHVLRMSKWLGWLPKDCDDPKKAAMFLHAYVPGPIMFNLHQAIWIHCANENTRNSGARDAICLVCGSSPPPKGTDIEKALEECPLTAILPPLAKRWGRSFKTSHIRTEKQPSPDTLVVKQNTDIPTEDNFDFDVSSKAESESSSEDTLVNSETASNTSPPRTRSPQPGSQTYEDPQNTLPSTVIVKRAKKLNIDKAVTIRFEDMPEDMIEDVQKAGFLLWEFRPMDNSFMEECGKVEKFPRYKWERPKIMDPEAAVTVEYAKEVLSGKRKHKWSLVDSEDLAMAQAIGAINA